MNRQPRKPFKGSGRRPGKAGTRRAGGRRTTGRTRAQRGPATDPARDAVMNALALQVQRYPDLAFDALQTGSLDERDAAFAHALYDTVIRRWITIRQVLRSQLKPAWDDVHPAARASLMCGAAQLLFMDTVPAHAAVNESVNWADAEVGGRTGGLVNAILRSVGRLMEVEPTDGEAVDDAETPAIPDASPAPLSQRVVIDAWDDRRDAIPLSSGQAVHLVAPIWPEDPLERLAIATSVPVHLLHSWAKHMPMTEVRRMALHCLVEPPVILNTAHARGPLPADGLEPHEAPGHHVMTAPSGGALRELLRARNDLWVQDPASSLAVESVVDLKPALVIDACAGLGTKTRQLAATFPEAQIIATDIDRVRHRGLVKTFKEHERVSVIPYGALADHAGQADLVLIDAPCSNTGVLARRLEARYRWSAARTDELVSMQRQILADAVRLLKPGKREGGLLYSTCSLDPRENEDLAAWARKWHGFDTAREHRRSPAGVPGDPRTRYTDGSYAILLV